MTSILDLHRAPVTVWVEDELSRQVLTDPWSDPFINVVSAGNASGVQSMVRGSPKSKRQNIFGIIDRDFATDNMERWENPDVRIFKLPFHEIENVLLDFQILAEISGHSESVIRESTRSRAEELVAWTACKDVLRKIVQDLPTTPSDPRLPSAAKELTVDDAVRYLRNPEFWSEFDPFVQRWSESEIRLQVQSRITERRQDLESDVWLRSFPGKELFRYIRSSFPELKGTGKTATDRDIDLGKRIALKLSNRPPVELTRLRQILRTRVGLS